MNTEFSRTLALLRKEQKVSQRVASEALGVSQALLSHYEKGVREPGLPFVVRACDYYRVSADFLLGRTLSRDGTVITADELYDLSEERGNSMRGSVLAMLSKKLLVNSIGMLFDLLGKTGNREAITTAADYLGTATTQVYRRLHSVSPDGREDVFAVSERQFEAGALELDMKRSDLKFVEILDEHSKNGNQFPDMSHDGLSASHAGLYQSLLQILHQSGERVAALTATKTEGK